MGTRIVKQPGGGYAVWSDVVDDFTIVDAIPGEIIDELVKEFRQTITGSVNDAVAALERGERPYMGFEECIARIREVHGDGTETLRHFGRGTA